MSLTFQQLRVVNAARCVRWHNAGISSWSASDWLTAIAGELGELASLIKMRNRERDGLPGNKFSPTQEDIAKEAADVAIYLDLFCAAHGIDLGDAIVQKFNEVSERVGFPERLDTEWLVPVGGILRRIVSTPSREPWCKEVLLYSPTNEGDSPENRVMLYAIKETP